MKKFILHLFLFTSAISFAQVGVSPSNTFIPNQNVSGNIRNSDGSNPIMLDVDGRVRVRAAENTATNESYSPLVRNNSTGEVKVISQNAPVKPFNYVTYRIENPQEDWVSNLNTQIPTSRYSLAVIGYRFFNANGGESGFINMSKPNVRNSANQNVTEITDNLNSISFSVAANVYAFKESNTWRLYADYAGGGSRYWSNGIWEIDVLIIDNAFVNVLNQVTTPLGGSASGTANLPSGLGL